MDPESGPCGLKRSVRRDVVVTSSARVRGADRSALRASSSGSHVDKVFVLWLAQLGLGAILVSKTWFLCRMLSTDCFFPFPLQAGFIIYQKLKNMSNRDWKLFGLRRGKLHLEGFSQCTIKCLGSQ